MLLYLPPWMGPRDRLRTIYQSAVRDSAGADVQRLAARYAGSAPHYSETERAQQLLAAASTPSYRGNTERDPTAGQYVDTRCGQVLAYGGDCIERTHALIALCLASGLDAMPLWLAEPLPAPLDHVIALIRADGVWQFADPLTPAAVLGVAPSAGATQIAM